MTVLPLYIFRSDREPRFVNGALAPLPAELGTSIYVELYRRAPPGWHVCGNGYHYFAATDGIDTKYVTPGLVIEGEPSPRKKLYFPPTKYTKRQIEKLTRNYIEERNLARQEAEEAKKDKEAELGILVHDLRALSSAIYNAGLEAKTDLERGHYGDCGTRIDNVIATQTLLSIRIDGLDLAANPILLTAPTEIPVFRRVDKVVRCFRAKGNSKRIGISLYGSSFGNVIGPNVFELIPFAIIDNAIKYSPAGQQIEVSIEETPSQIATKFRSVGPKIDGDETAKIFEKGYRGRHATAAGTLGTGIGLSVVSKLVKDHFGGSLGVTQTTEKFSIGMVSYFDTEFSFAFPRHS